MKAVCQRCGSDKPGPLVPCRSCTHVPVGEERTIAWLLSDHHLSPAELEVAAQRIRKGERLAPPEDLLDKARQGLREAIPGRRRKPRVAKPANIREPAQAAPTEPMHKAEGGPPTQAEVATGDPKPEPTWTSAPSLGALLDLDAAGPPGGVLPRWALGVLATASVVLTPLPAWVAWWLWRESAPQAARQVRGVAVATTVALVLVWAVTLTWTWGQRLG